MSEHALDLAAAHAAVAVAREAAREAALEAAMEAARAVRLAAMMPVSQSPKMPLGRKLMISSTMMQ